LAKPRILKPRDAATELAPQAERQPLPALVRIHRRPASPDVFVLAEGSCTIGAGAGSDVIVEDERVSRQHLELSLVPEGVEVRDLDSRNGTQYLGQRVSRMVLAFGSRVVIGGAEVAVEVHEDALQQAPESAQPQYRGILGASAAARRLFAKLLRLEGSLVNVVVLGESGVGKELVAKAIHEGSRVATGPFVVINCGALDHQLVRSELFGHKKGAFTGAVDSRAGAFELADGGTLFLDEIGELPLEVQPVLLRALEQGEITRVGDNEVRRVKVRMVAATHRDLRRMIGDRAFREDLYFRLSVVTLEVPPLRERLEDIPPLVRHFAERCGLSQLPSEVVAQFQTHNWLGNVRELRNAVEAYAAVGLLPDGGAPPALALDDALGGLIDPTKPYQQQKNEFVEQFSRSYFRRLIQHCRGNLSDAARIAEIERSYFTKLVDRFRAR
jgi:DNA-binding NtrC family response regulator